MIIFPPSVKNIARNQLAAELLTKYQIPLLSWTNANGTVLDGNGGVGKFSISSNGWGNGRLVLFGENANGNTKTDTISTEFVLPPEYVASSDVELTVHVKHDDTSGGTVGIKTIAVVVYKLSDAGVAGSDLNATLPQTLTNAFADYTFEITGTGLVVGDRFRIFVRTALQETVGVNDIYAQIGSIEMQLDIKG